MILRVIEFGDQIAPPNTFATIGQLVQQMNNNDKCSKRPSISATYSVPDSANQKQYGVIDR